MFSLFKDVYMSVTQVSMVTQNKTWRFSKRIKMITMMYGGRAFAALRPRRSNIITPENSPSPSSVNTTNMACTITIRERERFQEWYYCAEVEVMQSDLSCCSVVAMLFWVFLTCTKKPLGAPTFRVMELEVNWPIFTTCGLPVRKSWIQSQSVVFRPRSESLTASLGGTIVLKAEL